VHKPVEATKSCDINLGKSAVWAFVHKTREASFVDLHSEVQVLRVKRKPKLAKGDMHEILHENGTVGRVTCFLKKMSLLP
jgi:hypothetical protein